MRSLQGRAVAKFDPDLHLRHRVQPPNRQADCSSLSVNPMSRFVGRRAELHRRRTPGFVAVALCSVFTDKGGDELTVALHDNPGK